MCFSLAWLEQLCIYIVFIVALVTILRAVIPMLMSWAKLPEIVVLIINTAIWVVICCFAIYVIFGLLSCVFYGGGLSLMHH